MRSDTRRVVHHRDMSDVVEHAHLSEGQHVAICPAVAPERQDAILGRPGQQHGAADLIEVQGTRRGQRALEIGVDGTSRQGVHCMHRVSGTDPLRVRAHPAE